MYVSERGDVLKPAVLRAMGIHPKEWTGPPVQKQAELGRPALKTDKPTAAPVGPKQSLPVSGGVLMPEVDLDAVLADDAAREASQGKGAKRIGVIQDLTEPVSVEGGLTNYGFWQSTATGGSLWSVALYSPDALGMRIHFERVALPIGATLTVYNAGDPEESYGPYPERAQSAADFWSATCFADMAVVECFVPASVDRESVRIAIDRIVHNYVPFGEFARTKAAGTCNVDVACYDDWAGAASGVGGVGSINVTGSFFCSGCLVADTDTDTVVPYFLTANHCIGSAAQAANLEVFWLYQTSTCNGVPPSLGSVPRTTGGAQLLSTTNASEGTDFSLLRLNNAPPAGLAYMGWSSVPAPLSTVTACVHHPSVDFKRITFGMVTDVNESLRDLRPAERFYQSSWTLGTTEPGSSGSPLFIKSTQQIIGQLWGGPGSCITSTNLDYYGRFDVGYPLMAAYLDPEIVTAITVTRPNGDKNWPMGGRREIRWTSSGDVGEKVRIELQRNNGFVQVIKNGTKNDGKVGWNIDSSLDPGDGYTIRIISKSNPAVFDDSDVPFSLYDPEPGEPVAPGGDVPKQWPLLWFILRLLGFV